MQRNNRMVSAWLTLALGTGSAFAAAADGGGLESLAFLVGEWQMTGTTAPETFGEMAGSHAGRTVCAWGAFRSWLTCDFATDELGPLGPYGVHVVVWADGRGAYEGFVVNNYGWSRYRGEVESPGRAVFFGGTRGAEQRIVYQLLDDGRVHFEVTQTKDAGVTFRPHTEAYWQPPMPKAR